MWDEDATRILATCPQQVVRVVLVEIGEQRHTRTDGQHCTAAAGKSPDTPDTRDILVAWSRGCRACRACRRERHGDATRKLLPCNLGFSDDQRRFAERRRAEALMELPCSCVCRLVTGQLPVDAEASQRDFTPCPRWLAVG